MDKTNENKECLCKSSAGIFVTKRQVSAFVAGFVFFVFGFLVLGYFWGQKRAVAEFTNKIAEDAFADQANHSFYTLGDSEKDDDSEPETTAKDEEIKKNKEIANTSNQTQEKTNVAPDGKKYFAELVGFGNLNSANQFVKKMQKKGYNLIIKHKVSRTSRGRSLTWYQVITDKFDDKEKLQQIIDRIKISEKINGAKIIAA